MPVDVDHYKRLQLLVELIEQEPHKSILKLQIEALKYYPLNSQAAQISWLGSKTADAALKLADVNKTKELI